MIHLGQGFLTPDKKPAFRKRTIHKYQKGSVFYLDKNNNCVETLELSQSEKKETATPFDTTYRTLVTKLSKTLIPLVNEMFSLDISKEAELVKVNDIHFLRTGKLETDSVFKIGDHYYHVECESNPTHIGIRFIEYDFVIAIESMERAADGTIHLQFPRSGILMLRDNSQTPDREKVILHFPDGDSRELDFHIIKSQSYDEDAIFEKRLFFLIPFYIMRYEIKKSKSDSERKAAEKRMLDALEHLLYRLFLTCMEHEDLNLFYDIRELSVRVARALIKIPEFREEVTTVGRGELYELPSEKIRAAEAKAEQAEAKAEQAEEKVRILTEKLIKYGEDPATLFDTMA